VSTTKCFEILDALPAYGPMYIPISANGIPFYSEGFVVRFFKSDKTEWVANFRPGCTDFKGVFELVNSPNLLVLANGTCYIMNPEKTKPIKAFGEGFTEAIQTENGQIILQDQTDLTIIEPNAEYWTTERISWDGIKNIEFENGIIKGLAYDPIDDANEWVEFSYNIKSKFLIGGSYHRYDNKKPWWKIW